MATTSSYLKYLPPVLWSPPPAAGQFGLGTMLCVFEKILTGIDDGIVVTHGDNSVMTMVTQSVIGSPLPQTVRVTAGTGVKFLAGSSYTYNGATPEVIDVTAATANTITAVIRQNHAANQTIVNSSGTHRSIQDVIAGLVNLYGAWTTPADYLDWLAQWVALQMDPVWDEYQRRSVLSTIVGIYIKRGTKPGLDEYFDIYAIAKQRPRVVVDDDSKILFCSPKAGMIAPVSTLVSQRPMIAPKYIAYDPSGFLLVCDLGTKPDSSYSPQLWRISLAGDYDYSAGPPSAPQPFQPASLILQSPIAVAPDSVNGGAYLIDLGTDYVLYRLTSPQVGTIVLSGTPKSGENATIILGGVAYNVSQTTGFSLTQQANAWTTTLNGTSSFSSKYIATSSAGIITISPASGAPADDLTFVTTSGHLTLTVGPVSAASATLILSGVPTTGESSIITLEYGSIPIASYTLAETTGFSATQQAAAWVITLNGTASFNTKYVASSSGGMLTIAPLLLVAGDTLLLRVSSSTLQLAATGPRFGVSSKFADDKSIPPLGLVYPRAIVVSTAGDPLVLDRGAVPSSSSSTAIVDVKVAAGPVYSGTVRHAFGTIVEPTAMALRADGSLVVADAGNQNSATAADLVAINTTTWTATSLLSSVPSGKNPLVTPTGIVEVDSKHLMVLDSGLRPYIPYSAAPFSAVIAQQGAIYGVDLSVSPPVITRVSELKDFVYPLGMVGDGSGTLYACDSGLPDLASYKSRLWRSQPQQFSVVVHFQGNPAEPAFSIAVSGTPTTGSQCTLTIGSNVYPLAEVTGNTVAKQADAWAAALNGNPSFNALYIALGLGNVICLYSVPGTTATAASIGVTSSADMTLTPGLLAMTVAITGTPTTKICVINIGPPPGYNLTETTGNTDAQQATAWAATLNGNPVFSKNYSAVATGNVIAIFYKSTNAGYNPPSSVTSSTDVTLTATFPPYAIGTVSLTGTPTGGESCSITVGGVSYPIPAETGGLTTEQQADVWCTALNAQPAFSALYIANHTGGTINLFSLKAPSPAGVSLSAVSSAHLNLAAYSELQNRQQFLQSIRDVVADEIPAHTRWYLQSELSQLSS